MQITVRGEPNSPKPEVAEDKVVRRRSSGADTRAAKRAAKQAEREEARSARLALSRKRQEALEAELKPMEDEVPGTLGADEFSEAKPVVDTSTNPVATGEAEVKTPAERVVVDEVPEGSTSLEVTELQPSLEQDSTKTDSEGEVEAVTEATDITSSPKDGIGESTASGEGVSAEAESGTETAEFGENEVLSGETTQSSGESTTGHAGNTTTETEPKSKKSKMNLQSKRERKPKKEKPVKAKREKTEKAKQVKPEKVRPEKPIKSKSEKVKYSDEVNDFDLDFENLDERASGVSAASVVVHILLHACIIAGGCFAGSRLVDFLQPILF